MERTSPAFARLQADLRRRNRLCSFLAILGMQHNNRAFNWLAGRNFIIEYFLPGTLSVRSQPHTTRDQFAHLPSRVPGLARRGLQVCTFYTFFMLLLLLLPANIRSIAVGKNLSHGQAMVCTVCSLRRAEVVWRRKLSILTLAC